MEAAGEKTTAEAPNMEEGAKLKERERLLTAGAYGYTPSSPTKKNIDKRTWQRRHSGPESVKRSGPYEGMDCDGEEVLQRGLQEVVGHPTMTKDEAERLWSMQSPPARSGAPRCRTPPQAVPVQLPLQYLRRSRAPPSAVPVQLPLQVSGRLRAPP